MSSRATKDRGSMNDPAHMRDPGAYLESSLRRSQAWTTDRAKMSKFVCTERMELTAVAVTGRVLQVQYKPTNLVLSHRVIRVRTEPTIPFSRTWCFMHTNIIASHRIVQSIRLLLGITSSLLQAGQIEADVGKLSMESSLI